MKKYVKSSLNFSSIDDFYKNGLTSNDHSLLMYSNRWLRDDLSDIQKAIMEGNEDDLKEAYELMFEDTYEALSLMDEMVDVVNEEINASGLMTANRHLSL